MRCWNDLAGERQLGFGAVGNIPARAIDWWCKRARLDEEAARLLSDVIFRLDSDRVEREAAERRKKK